MCASILHQLEVSREGVQAHRLKPLNRSRSLVSPQVESTLPSQARALYPERAELQVSIYSRIGMLAALTHRRACRILLSSMLGPDIARFHAPKEAKCPV